jgi:single-strand DNA-binding protein
MARGLNKVMVIGFLGRDPEMRFTPSGKSVANFSIASSRSWKTTDGETHTETEWFNVVAWERLAEISKEYLSKGSRVYVEGRLQSRNWQDSEGNQHKSLEIVAKDILLLSDNKFDEGSTDSEEDSETYPF